jgi:NAD(P)-dependent dehydrogenase (short-subunit alcohol dehydrogenase family)
MVSSPSNDKVAVVTGSSSGIGYETSLMLARNGFLTYATMRNVNKSENIKPIAAKENLRIRITKSLCIKSTSSTGDPCMQNVTFQYSFQSSFPILSAIV